jgi:hypothetical protein
VPQVRIAEKRIWAGSESRALLHGELHYWRLSPARWRDALRSARDVGLDVVSSYVCWDFHEIQPGRYDFRGETDPLRNLVGFLRLAAAEGFWVVLRPGPYIYAEWPNSGVPDRVVQYHRLHPEFCREAERYMAAAVEAFAPFLATRGGPIVLVQADNEPDPWADHYAAQLGLARDPGPFQAFLRERYGGDLARLEAAWGTTLGGFDAARAVLAPVHTEHAVRYLDVVRFCHHYTAEIVRWAADVYRRLGVDVPIYANAYSGFGVQHWPKMQGAVDVVGPDVYPSAELRSDPAEHRRMLERVRFTRTHSPLPYIPEFEAGIWHGWHDRIGVLTANHYRLICLSALLAGVAGWGWYMLVSRDNWSMSPIDEFGRARPDLAGELSSIVRMFRRLDPPGLEKLTNTAVAMDLLQLGAKLGGPPAEPLLEALYRADVDFECFDVDTGHISKPLVFYSGSDWLGRAAQERLLAYVENGGTLVFFQDLPLRDEQMQPLNLLALHVPDGVLRAEYPRRLAVELGTQRATCSSSSFGWYAGVPGQPLVAERLPEAATSQQGLDLHARLQEGERYVVGYREPRGAGRIVCLGVEPSPQVVLTVHDWLGVAIPIRAASSNITSALFRRKDGASFVVAVNNGNEEHEASLSLGPDQEVVERATDLFTGSSWPLNGDLRVRLAQKSGTVVRLD